MPQSRKRQGHHTHPKTSALPARQRTRGRTIWAVLCAVFGLLIAYFASEENYWVLIIGALLGGLIGYYVGKRMEEEA